MTGSDVGCDADPAKRLKADFFIELYPVRNDRAVNNFSWFDKDKFTDDMLRKFEEKGIKSVTDFRIVKQHINHAVKARKLAAVSIRLREFADQPSLTPDHLNIESAKVVAEAKKILKLVDRLYAQVNEINTENFYGEKALWTRLESLAQLM